MAYNNNTAQSRAEAAWSVDGYLNVYVQGASKKIKLGAIKLYGQKAHVDKILTFLNADPDNVEALMEHVSFTFVSTAGSAADEDEFAFLAKGAEQADPEPETKPIF